MSSAADLIATLNDGAVGSKPKERALAGLAELARTDPEHVLQLLGSVDATYRASRSRERSRPRPPKTPRQTPTPSERARGTTAHRREGAKATLAARSPRSPQSGSISDE